MPASIVASLLLWSTLLHPEATLGSPRDGGTDLACCCSLTRTTVDRQPVLLGSAADPSDIWLLSEADNEEEDTRDGDDLGIISRDLWTFRHPPRPGPLSTLVVESGVDGFAFRSPILRC